MKANKIFFMWIKDKVKFFFANKVKYINTQRNIVYNSYCDELSIMLTKGTKGIEC